jgi:hypothetical protein
MSGSIFNIEPASALWLTSPVKKLLLIVTGGFSFLYWLLLPQHSGDVFLAVCDPFFRHGHPLLLLVQACSLNHASMSGSIFKIETASDVFENIKPLDARFVNDFGGFIRCETDFCLSFEEPIVIARRPEADEAIL